MDGGHGPTVAVWHYLGLSPPLFTLFTLYPQAAEPPMSVLVLFRKCLERRLPSLPRLVLRIGILAKSDASRLLVSVVTLWGNLPLGWFPHCKQRPGPANPEILNFQVAWTTEGWPHAAPLAGQPRQLGTGALLFSRLYWLVGWPLHCTCSDTQHLAPTSAERASRRRAPR